MPEARAKSRGKGRGKPAPRTAEQKPASRWWIYAVAAAIAVYLGFQIYAPAIGGPFVFDDSSLPYHTPGFSDSLRAWMAGVRPLLMLSYWLNYQVSQDPTGFHITNIFIHLLNSLLVFFIIRKLQHYGSPSRPLAPSPAQPRTDEILPTFAAAIFLLHPIQTESVSYVAGRSECLSVLFFLGAFTVFLYRRSAAVSWQTAIAVLALFGAAVLTKEHTLVLPALLLLTDYYWNPGFSFSGIRRNWRLYVPIAAGVVAGAIFVIRVLAYAGSTAGFALKDFTWYQYFFTECRAFFLYLRLLVFPAGQNVDWDFPISRNLLDHGAIFGLVVMLVLVAAAIYFRRRYPLASYGFFVYLLLLAPTSSIVPIKDPVAERRLYLPMIGFLLVMTAALRYVRMNRRVLAGILGAVAVVLAIVTYQRNQVWTSDIALWQDAAAKSPRKARVHFQLAHTYYSNGRCQDAVTQYGETAQLQKPDYGLMVDWGLAYDCVNQPEVAVVRMRAAAALEPTAHVYSQIAMVYAKRSRWPEALEALAQAEKIDPNYDMIYDTRGGIRAKTNDWAGAAADYRRAVEINPANDHARQMLGIVERQLAAPH